MRGWGHRAGATGLGPRGTTQAESNGNRPTVGQLVIAQGLRQLLFVLAGKGTRRMTHMTAHMTAHMTRASGWGHGTQRPGTRPRL